MLLMNKLREQKVKELADKTNEYNTSIENGDYKLTDELAFYIQNLQREVSQLIEIQARREYSDIFLNNPLK